MTNQELYDKMARSINLHGAKAAISFESATNIAKAYAASEVEKAVAAKGKEIAELKAEKKRLREGIEWLFKNEAWDSENHCYLVHPSYLKELLSPGDETQGKDGA